jgi:hypothetical protein
MKGDDGIMLVSTVSLANLLRKGDMTSEDLLETYRHNEGNIYLVISRDSFIEVKSAGPAHHSLRRHVLSMAVQMGIHRGIDCVT